MRANDVWRAFTVLYALALATASAFMVNQSWSTPLVLFIAVVALSAYLYIVYKRYHVELITEGDLKLFDDPDDLQILCRIYGLPHKGSPNRLRHRLAQFSRRNDGKSFVWVAPLFMKNLVSNLELAPETDEDELPEDSSELLLRMVSPGSRTALANRPLVWGRQRSASRRQTISSCPICDSTVGQRAPVCEECGADLEFYDVLQESRIGRKLIAQKAGGRKV